MFIQGVKVLSLTPDKHIWNFKTEIQTFKEHHQGHEVRVKSKKCHTFKREVLNKLKSPVQWGQKSS